MNNKEDFKIELGPSVRRHIENKKSPLDDASFCALPYDSPNTDQIPVFIDEKVMRSIETHVLREKEKEVGGVLLGNFYRNDKSSFIEITDFIEAKSTKGTDVSLTFTHETWEQITTDHAEKGNSTQIIGWYHSHPALGVFMSKEDEFIHSNFFADPWQVAVVVDPIYHNWGCFKRNDGSIERTGGFYVFADKKSVKRIKNYTKTLAAAKQSAPRSASASADRRDLAKPKSPSYLWIIIALLLVSQLATVYFAFVRSGSSNDNINYYKSAVELLTASDLSEGTQYLKQELITHPENDIAFRELTRVNTILENASISKYDNDRLDRINFLLLAADKTAKKKVETQKQSMFAGLDTKTKEDFFTPLLAADDPFQNVLTVYKDAASSRAIRLQRAILIKQVAGAKSHSRSAAWYDKAIERINGERLREIAYGVQTGNSSYADKYKKLSDKDKSIIKRIRAGFGKQQ